jgi:hypothetical protein
MEIYDLAANQALSRAMAFWYIFFARGFSTVTLLLPLSPILSVDKKPHFYDVKVLSLTRLSNTSKFWISLYKANGKYITHYSCLYVQN